MNSSLALISSLRNDEWQSNKLSDTTGKQLAHFRISDLLQNNDLSFSANESHGGKGEQEGSWIKRILKDRTSK